MAVRELARVVQPGGYLLSATDNRWRLHYLLNPSRTPLFEFARRAIRSLRAASAVRTDSRLNRQHSIRQTDAFAEAAGLEKICVKTLGFGPFRLFKFQSLPDGLGIKVHEALQCWADRGVPFIHSIGGQYMILARKPGQLRVESDASFAYACAIARA